MKWKNVLIYDFLLVFLFSTLFYSTGYGVEPAFNLSYDDVTCMWHHIPYGGINMIGAVENLMHTTPFGVTRPPQSHPNQMCLCETCVFDSRNTAKQLKTSTILNPSIGLGVGEIKTFFKQGWWSAFLKTKTNFIFICLKFKKKKYELIW